MCWRLYQLLCIGLVAWAVATVPTAAIELHVAPGGSGTRCSKVRPCLPQRAVEKCSRMTNPERACGIVFRDGLYDDPALNIHYHITIYLVGNCNNPVAVELRATKPNTALVWVQDHATLMVSCMKL